MNYYSYSNYINKQKKRIELYFTYNYENIDSFTFTSIDKTPMGALVFYGYFNHDKNYKFSADIMPDQKEFEQNSGINGDFAKKNAKFEDGKTYSVSEIEKKKSEEKRKKRKETNSTTKVYQPNWFNEKDNG